MTVSVLRKIILPALVLGWALLLAGPATAAGDCLDREILPLQRPEPETYSELDVRKVKPPQRFEVKAPAGAPNVVIVLIDDLGFGATSPFGGPIKTPTLDRLAREGLRYNNFNTTSLCSPTRAALKSGRNHHTCNVGSIMETSTVFPGNTGSIPNRVAPLAEILRLNGYSTAAFGKWHETAVWETSLSGPFDRWPTRQGFDKFYGFIGGETNQWSPLIYDGTRRVYPPRTKDYHFTTDITNQAIRWVRAQQAMTPDRPFFIYFAPGAVHAPHHVPKAWADRYRGKFDAGWDEIREQTWQHQKKLGVIPPETRLPPKPEAIKDWKKLDADHRRLFARQAEVFAGFTEMTDREIGRLVNALNEIGALDNTLFIYIAGDNGTSAEGSFTGLVNELSYFNGSPEKFADQLKMIDQWGSPETYPHMANGWAVAFDAPFTWTKQVASDFGGTRNGMVIHWPKGIAKKEQGGIRSQFSHVIDIAPTVLEVCGLPEPRVVDGTPQAPIEGTSLVYTFNHPEAAERHTIQYFELFGNRALYYDGWLARTIHRAPWQVGKQKPLADDVWDLYNVRQDFSLADNLAAKYPDKLKEMQELFLWQARIHHVLPLDDRTLERFNPALVGRPDLMHGRTSLTLYPGMESMLENTFLNLKNRSWKLVAEIEIPQDEPARGAIIGQGGSFGGWSLYCRKGRPAFVYNYLGRVRYVTAAPQPAAPGPLTVQVDFIYDGGGLGKGGKVELRLNHKLVASGRVEHTQAIAFAADEPADVGFDSQTPVAAGIGSGRSATRFNGKIRKITIEQR